VKHQNGRRSLVDVSEVLLAVGAEADSGNAGEDGAVLIAAVLGAELQGAQDAEVNKTSLVFPG